MSNLLILLYFCYRGSVKCVTLLEPCFLICKLLSNCFGFFFLCLLCPCLITHVAHLDLDSDKKTLPSPQIEITSPISNGQTIGNNGNSAFAPVTKIQSDPRLDETPTKEVEELSPDKKALAKLTETIGSTCLLRSIIEAEMRPSSPAMNKQIKKEEAFTPPAPRREDQGIFDYASKIRPYYTRASPVPHGEVHTPSHQVPHDIASLLPPASLVRSLSPAVTLSFPPVFPVFPAKPHSRCTSPDPQFYTEISPPNIEPLPRQVPEERKEKPQEEMFVPTISAEHVTDLPKYYETLGPLAEAMTTAPITPFSPVPFPEPIEIPSMKPLPPETKPVLVRPESPMLNALTVAPDRCYSPLPSITEPLKSLTELSDLNKPVNLLFGEKEEKPKPETCRSMLSALTIASDRPYSPIPAPPPPVPLPVVHHIIDAPFETYVPKVPGTQETPSKQSGKADSKSSDKTHRPDDESYPHQFPLTSSGLHVPATIPHYQEHIDEVSIQTMLRNSPLHIKTAAQESLSIQSKIMNILTQQETVTSKTTSISVEPLKPSTLDFLKPKDESTKIIPTLGYKPNSIVELIKGASQKEEEGTEVVDEVKSKQKSSGTTKQDACQKVCQSQCQALPECYKNKQPVEEKVQKVDSKPVFEPKVKFERQNTFEPKSTIVEPQYSSNPNSTAPNVSSELSRKLSCLIPSMPDPNPSSLPSNAGNGAGGKGSGLTTAPRRGRGVLNPQNLTPGARVPQCGQCYQQIR